MNMPQLIDRKALARNRARAEQPALFLQEEAAYEIEERLIEVNRTFTSIAVITGFPEFWQEKFPNATIVADDEVLNLKSNQHDLVVHSMCLHWANDPVGQLVQSRHALKPDGLLISVSLGGQTLQELRIALAEAEVEVTGGLSPRIAPMGEIRDLGGLLQRAGFAMPVADSRRQTVSYANAFHLMHDLRKMGENSALTDRRKTMTRRDVLIRASQIYAEHFKNADNRVDATFELITLTGWAPAADQPQPLRPGSAKTRLADALGTFEVPLDKSND